MMNHQFKEGAMEEEEEGGLKLIHHDLNKVVSIKIKDLNSEEMIRNNRTISSALSSFKRKIEGMMIKLKKIKNKIKNLH